MERKKLEACMMKIKELFIKKKIYSIVKYAKSPKFLCDNKEKILKNRNLFNIETVIVPKKTLDMLSKMRDDGEIVEIVRKTKNSGLIKRGKEVLKLFNYMKSEQEDIYDKRNKIDDRWDAEDREDEGEDETDDEEDDEDDEDDERIEMNKFESRVRNISERFIADFSVFIAGLGISVEMIKRYPGVLMNLKSTFKHKDVPEIEIFVQSIKKSINKPEFVNNLVNAGIMGLTLLGYEKQLNEQLTAAIKQEVIDVMPIIVDLRKIVASYHSASYHSAEHV